MPEDFLLLIQRVRGGDEAAVRTLIDQYGDTVRRVIRLQLLDSRIRRLVGESDVFQSVISRFVFSLWAGQFDFESPQQLGALLRKIAKSCVIDATRHHTAQRRDVRRNEKLAEFGNAQQALNPSRIVADKEFLKNALERFSETELRILNWRQEKKSWEEIARILGESSREAVRKRFERATNRVAAEMQLNDSFDTI